jgi:hypothetical protein
MKVFSELTEAWLTASNSGRVFLAFMVIMFSLPAIYLILALVLVLIQTITTSTP